MELVGVSVVEHEEAAWQQARRPQRSTMQSGNCTEAMIDVRVSKNNDAEG